MMDEWHTTVYEREISSSGLREGVSESELTLS